MRDTIRPSPSLINEAYMSGSLSLSGSRSSRTKYRRALRLYASAKRMLYGANFTDFACRRSEGSGGNERGKERSR